LNGKFLNFTAPKFIRFHNLNAPSVAEIYNFTLFVANHTNSIGYPDFVHAWNRILFVPVSMSDDPASISGTICDFDTLTCPVIIHDQGIVYARNVNTGQIARAYVNETSGRFNEQVQSAIVQPGIQSLQNHSRLDDTVRNESDWRVGRNPPSVLSDIHLVGIPASQAAFTGAYYPFHGVCRLFTLTVSLLNASASSSAAGGGIFLRP
jgi:hypothetical protein